VYNDFNLTIEMGKITCILGESGSGKTTLLNVIAGLTEYSGSVTNVKCSYIFQTPRLVPNLTVYGNLALVCKDDAKIEEMLKRVGLYDKRDSYPIKLSGGQAQRVAIARAFLFGGEAILMDEPFSSLDLKLKYEMTELFLDLWRGDGRTAVFVTHDVDEASTVAHRIIVIKGGKIVYDKSSDGALPRDLKNGEEVRRELISALLEK
ncbi:MAG: ATP-binding cassette domain-containing protein, partial [Clostridia bacterium]|nr:ATP-binding cassette domain-containing protein [Clostridia bacterium]